MVEMHGDAAGWAKMEEASAVAHRMEAVEGRETGLWCRVSSSRSLEGGV